MPFSCAPLAASQLIAVLNLTAVQLIAGCLPAEALQILRFRPLGIHVRGAAASRAFHSAELMRRAASRGAASEGGVSRRGTRTGSQWGG